MRRALQPFLIASFRPRRLPLWNYVSQSCVEHPRQQSSLADRALYTERSAPGPPDPTNSTYADLIYENADAAQGSAANVSSLLQEMEESGLAPDSMVCHAAIRALAVHPDPFLLSSILGVMRENWLELTDLGWHDVVVAQIKNSQMEQALENLEEMRKADLAIRPWLLDMAVYALCDRGELDEALRIMQDRVRAGGTGIPRSSWYYLFDAACGILHYPTITFVWKEQIDSSYISPTSGQCLAVLNAAARHADVGLATSVFRVFNARTDSSPISSAHYELLMDAYLASDDITTPITILCIMNAAGTTINRSTTRNLFTALRAGGPDRIELAYRIVHKLKTERPDRAIPSAIMDTILEATVKVDMPDYDPSLDDHFRRWRMMRPLAPLDAHAPFDPTLSTALERFDALKPLCEGGPTLDTYNILLQRCALAQHSKKVSKALLNEMGQRQIAPNALTFDHLINVCVMEAARLKEEVRVAQKQDERDIELEKKKSKTAWEAVDDAMGYLEEMRAHNWTPQSSFEGLVQALVARSDARAWEVVEWVEEEGREIDRMDKVKHWMRANWTGEMPIMSEESE